jgi:hypothetical protein
MGKAIKVVKQKVSAGYSSINNIVYASSIQIYPCMHFYLSPGTYTLATNDE